MAETLQPGDDAPDFTLMDEQNQKVSLADLRGTPVVLMFYPLDFSPICEGEMCQLRDTWGDRWENFDGEVFGVSRDSVWSHKAWKQQQGFKHRLLADMDGAVAKAYGAWNEARGFANRMTAVIDRDGKIAWIDLTENAGVVRDQEKVAEAASVLSRAG